MKEFIENSELLAASIRRFWKDEDGQDFLEYTLLMAFVALFSAAFYASSSTSITQIWSTSNNTLSMAAVDGS
jgi:Flp pilus assembly pilin Flp